MKKKVLTIWITRSLALLTILAILLTPLHAVAVIEPVGPDGGGNSRDDFDDLTPPTNLDPDGNTGQNNGNDASDFDDLEAPTNLDPDGNVGQNNGPTPRPTPTPTNNPNRSSGSYQDPNFEGPAYENPDNFGPDTVGEDTPEAKQSQLEMRNQKDAEAAKADAEKKQQEEQADQQKCESQQGQTGSKLQQALNETFSKTAKTLFTQIPKALEGQLSTSLNSAISDSLNGRPETSNGGIDFKTELGNELVNQARQRFNVNFKDALERESLGGTQIIEEGRLRQIAQEELRKAFQESYKGALKKSLYTTLAGDSVNQRPGVLRTLTKQQLPLAVNQTLTSKGPGVFASTSETVFQSSLGTDTFNLTSDRLQDALSKLGNTVGAGTSANSTLITQVAGAILKVLAQQALSTIQEQRAFDQLSDEITARFDSSEDGLDSRLNSFSFETIVKNNSGQLNGAIDFALSRQSSGGSSFDNNIGQGIDSVVAQTFSSANLTQNFGNIADSIVNTAFNGNNGQLNNAINGLFQSTVGDGVAGLGNVVTGSISGEVNGLMQNALGSVAGQGGFAGELVGQLSGPLGEVTNQIMAPVLDPINGAINGVTKNITDSISGAIGGSLGGVFGDAVGGVLGNIGGLISDPIGTISSAAINLAVNTAVKAIAGPVVSGLTGGIAGSAVGSALGLGPFVPTTEQLGILTIGITGIQTNTSAISATTKSTDATVKDTNKLTVDICTKEKSMQRIAEQEARMRNVTNPQMRRDAASIIENWRTKVSDFIQKGYKKVDNGQTTDNPLYVTNNNKHYSDARTEAKAVFMDTLASSGNIFKEQITNSIRADETRNKLTSSITKNEYAQFQNGQIQNSDDWWRIFQSINDPFSPDSPENSERISRNLLASAETQATKQAEQDLIANQGYLPVRNCAEYTKDGQACAKWVNVTPAIQVKETVAQAFAFRPEKYTNPEPGDVAPGNEPNLNELRLFSPSTGGGGAKGPAAVETKDIVSLLTNLLTRLQQFRTNQNNNSNEPSVAFDYSIPPVSATESGQATNAITINWEGKKITTCTAGNDWLGNSTSGGTILNIKAKGQDLGSKGQVTIPIPLDFGLRYIRTRNGIDGSYNVASQNLSNITTMKTIGLPESDTLSPGDILSIRFYPYYMINGVSTTITAANVNNPLPDLKTAIQSAYTNTANSLIYSELNKFTPTYNTNSISFIPKLVYTINCITESGSTTTKTINVQAQ